MINYKDLINNLQSDKIINLMGQLGADRYIEKEGYIIFPTICHNVDADEASMKLYFYKDTKLFYCYTNCEGQSIFKFLEHYYQTRNIEYDWYTDIYLVVKNCSLFKETDFNKIERTESIKDKYSYAHILSLPEIDKRKLDVFIKQYPQVWLDDGISQKAMDKFNILFSISQNKIIIPHYDINNRLIGIRGRALDEWEVENIGKYLPVRIENIWYKHPLSLNLYGLNVTKDNIKKNRVCYLFESEKSVMQLESFNISNCGAAVCGSNLNKFQLKLLIKNCQPNEIVICFDKEEKDGEDKYFNKLFNLCSKYKNYCNFSFIYDRNNLLEMKDSPTDKGEETFKKLLERRVRVQ